MDRGIALRLVEILEDIEEDLAKIAENTTPAETNENTSGESEE